MGVEAFDSGGGRLWIDYLNFFTRRILFEWALAVRAKNFKVDKELILNVKSQINFVCVGVYNPHVVTSYPICLGKKDDIHERPRL